MIEAEAERVTAKQVADYIKYGQMEGLDSPESPRDAYYDNSNRSGPLVVNPYQAAVSVTPSRFNAVRVDPLPVPNFVVLADSAAQLSVQTALAYMPYVETARVMSTPSVCGVIRLTNIPYTCSKNEILAIVGHNTAVVKQPESSPFFAVHIIIERQTSKTMDCFVEVATQIDAHMAIMAYERRSSAGRYPRIGDRPVRLRMSSQAELMSKLFPRAGSVVWDGQIPNIQRPHEPFDTGFHDFLTSEELVCIVKHAETPQRVSSPNPFLTDIDF